MRIREQFENKPSMTQVMAAFEESSHVETTAVAVQEQLRNLYERVYNRWFQGRPASEITDSEARDFKLVYDWLIAANDAITQGVFRSRTVAKQTSDMIKENLPDSSESGLVE